MTGIEPLLADLAVQSGQQGATIQEILLDLLPIALIAAGVGVFVAKVGKFPYTIALLLAGIGVSIIRFATGQFGIEIALSHDLILLVLLPPLLFEGAATTDLERLRRNLAPILALAAVGLVTSVAVVGFVGNWAFSLVGTDFTILLALLFAAMALPTDPVSVLALFKELGAPDRLSVLVEGESLVNDGVGVVIFTAFLGFVASETAPSELFSASGLGSLAVEILVVSGGGLLVGLVAGYAVYSVMINLDEHMTEIVLTLILTYGSFLLAEHYLHVSGVIATVVAGLFIGNRGTEYAMSPQTKISVFNALETMAFLVNTFIFLMIGVTTPIDQVADNAELIVVAIVLVLLARAVAVYPITAVVNRFIDPAIPRKYQHVMWWGGLHGSIPIALVLGLPPTLESGAAFPLREELRAMVFGVAAFSLVVQGLTMSNLMDRLDIVTRSDAEELYELLIGRRRAVEEALDAAERLKRRGDLPREVYEDFTGEYEREQEDLQEAIAALLSSNPELRRERLLVGERQVLQQEKSALMDAIRAGVITDDVGDRLLNEVNLKLEQVRNGETTVERDEEGYAEFWRSQAQEFGLDVEAEGDRRAMMD
ncbi:Na+/H+ antiporter [Halomarina litorea]|uniref:Na+/H+ antiporter n=1 Tax=Halomarina litorea TaxID=2961595 RepID=UPI0020C50FC9|nr:Na+/H+ antiporter [Halomarina sp. BCD28]